MLGTIDVAVAMHRINQKWERCRALKIKQPKNPGWGRNLSDGAELLDWMV